MHEINAVLRFTLSKNRLWLQWAGAFVALFQVMFIAVNLLPDVPDKWIRATGLILLAPVAFILLGVCNFCDNAGLNAQRTAYQIWMFRLPIKNWKLWAIPLAIKLTLYSAFTLLLVANFSWYAGESRTLDLVQISLCLFAINLWTLAWSWRPFSTDWMRLALTVVGGLTLYGGVVLSLSATFGPPPKTETLHGTMMSLARWLPLTGCILGAVATRRAFKVARYNAWGTAPTTTGSVTERRLSEVPPRQLGNSTRALVWHDMLRSRGANLKCIGLLLIPGIVFLGTYTTLQASTVVFALLNFAYVGGAIGYNAVTSNQVSGPLPIYLAVSPLSSARISWTRAVSCAAMVSLGFAGIGIVIGLWALRPTCVENWNAWSASLAETTGEPNAGPRVAAAIVLGCYVFWLGRVIANMWVGQVSNTWLTFTWVASIVACYFVPAMIDIAWFVQQPSWESAKQSALQWMETLLPIVFIALFAKLILTSWVTWRLRSENLVSAVHIALFIMAWAWIVGILSLVLNALVPASPLAPIWIFAITAMTIPLARVLALPLALYHGRHR